MEPTIVYKNKGPHRGPKGSTYSYKGVSDEATLKTLLSDGWFSTLAGALNPVKEILIPKAPLESIEDLLKAGKEPKEIADIHAVHINSVYKVKRDMKDAL
jgi:hypothetical protein